ncbi:MAG: hypothetical protein QOE19_2230 [Actinomycetota bacterium]|jgi:uncharacterized membrane protein YbhN (UPF0104 family)|nr:hypothetical protein [Actinomycetota bacterium]MDQ1667037.1 hypothetical protein [Actinomycetota bacterium]MDQ1670046.1 hypothetical protein [Actinomycetota bacterium]
MAVAVGVALLALHDRSSIGTGGATLAAADGEWLLFALGLTTALWVAGTAAQLGSVPIRPPLSQLFAVQVAASVVNHVVPGGVGGMAVNVRYLQRTGMSRPAALGAVGLNSVATMVTHLALIAAVWACAPAVLPGGALTPGLNGALGLPAGWLPGTVRAGALAAGVLVLGVVALAVTAGPARCSAVVARAWTRVAAAARHVARELRSSAAVLRRPGRAGLLWAGSAASPALHALILVAVYNSLSVGLAPLAVALAYLVASSVAALVPSPGGFGALDVTLVAGLVAIGAPPSTAVASVLGYRLLTVWVPLVPGALVLAWLMRRHVL